MKLKDHDFNFRAYLQKVCRIRDFIVIEAKKHGIPARLTTFMPTVDSFVEYSTYFNRYYYSIQLNGAIGLALDYTGLPNTFYTPLGGYEFAVFSTPPTAGLQNIFLTYLSQRLGLIRKEDPKHEASTKFPCFSITQDIDGSPIPCFEFEPQAEYYDSEKYYDSEELDEILYYLERENYINRSVAYETQHYLPTLFAVYRTKPLAEQARQNFQDVTIMTMENAEQLSLTR